MQHEPPADRHSHDIRHYSIDTERFVKQPDNLSPCCSMHLADTNFAYPLTGGIPGDTKQSETCQQQPNYGIESQDMRQRKHFPVTCHKIPVHICITERLVGVHFIPYGFYLPQGLFTVFRTKTQLQIKSFLQVTCRQQCDDKRCYRFFQRIDGKVAHHTCDYSQTVFRFRIELAQGMPHDLRTRRH